MRVYEIKKKDNSPNVFGISLVAVPAMESNYVQLSKNTKDLSKDEKISLSKENDIKFSEISKEKRLLLGLVLEPDKMIYRFNKELNEEYYITVSAETILELQQDYIKNSHQGYSTLEHDGKELDGVTFTEHWIVENSKIDKSAVHNLSFKKGSWVTVAKIENDTLWNDYIKTGNVMGFSIDAMVHLEEVNLKTETMSEQKSELLQYAIDAIRMSLGLSSNKEAVKVDLMEDEDEEKKKEEIEMVEDGTAEPMVEETPSVTVEDVASDIAKIKAVFAEMGISLASTIKEALKPLQDANLELKKEVDSLKSEVVELSEAPASKPIKKAPQSVDFSKLSEWDKRQYHKQNG
jgi:hypothetical protein